MALPTNWTISGISQNQYDEKNIKIYFLINGVAYSLRVRMVNGFFKPQYVSHLNYSVCDSFEPYVLDLFYELIQFPSIRLEWLYIPHVEV